MAEQTDGQIDQGFDTGGGDVGGQPDMGGADNAVLSHLQELSGKVDQLMGPQPQFPSFGEVADPNYDLYGGYEDPSGYEEPQQPQFDPQQQPYQQDPYGQPQQPPGMSPQEVEQWLDQRIDQRAEQRAQQIITPYINEQRAKALEAQYPDLGKPETIAQIAPEASRLAASMGLDPDTGWRHPEFLAMVYQAQQARQSASQQIAPEDQFDGNGYEGGGAGAPGADDEPNIAERILAAYPHGDAHTFWGG